MSGSLPEIFGFQHRFFARGDLCELVICDHELGRLDDSVVISARSAVLGLQRTDLRVKQFDASNGARTIFAGVV